MSKEWQSGNMWFVEQECAGTLYRGAGATAKSAWARIKEQVEWDMAVNIDRMIVAQDRLAELEPLKAMLDCEMSDFEQLDIVEGVAL